MKVGGDIDAGLDGVLLVADEAVAIEVAQFGASVAVDTDGNGAIQLSEGLVTNRPYLMTNHLLGEVFVASGDESHVPSVGTGGEIPNGRAWEYLSYVYYIQDGGDAAPPALARKRLQWDGSTSSLQMVTEVVADGVEALRVLYGFDTNNDGDPDTFAPASGVTNWDGVVSARIYLLVRSPEPDRRFQDGKTYRLGDVTVSATQAEDASQGAQLRNFHRMVLSTTVTVRNPNLILTGGF